MSQRPIYLKFNPSKEEEQSFKNYLNDLYLNPHSPVSYSSPSKIWYEIKRQGKYTNIGQRRIQKYLTEFDSYSQYRPQIYNFKHPYVHVFGVGVQADSDLMDVSASSKFNDGVKFLYISIDILSKYLYVIPLKSKSANEVTSAARKIYTQHKISYLSTDRGSEYRSRSFKYLMRQLGIKHFFAGGSTKSAVSERVIRTIRGRIARFKAQNNTERYIDSLKDIVSGYNATIHSSTSIPPRDINKYNDYIALRNIYKYKKPHKTRPYRFKVGDKIRISSAKSLFRRESYERWSYEIFEVTSRFRKDGVNLYKIRGCDDDQDLQGSFFQEELSKVKQDINHQYKISKFLDEENRYGVPYVLVQWKNYPRSCATWLPKTSVAHI